MKRLGARWVRTLGALGLGMLLGASSSLAYFPDYGGGARPAGMGRAFVAVADDANTVNWNPAGLAMMDRYELTGMYASLFAGLDARLYTGNTDQLGYNYLAAAVPLEPAIGAAGASWTQFGSSLYRETMVTLAYAREIQFEGEKFSLGGSFKFLNWATSGSSEGDPNLSKNGFTADAGLLYLLPEHFRLGASLENFIPADMGVTTVEEVPRNFRLGLAWGQDVRAWDTVLDTLLISTEWLNRSYAQNTNAVRIGAEIWILDGIMGVRSGYNPNEFTFSVSGRYGPPQWSGLALQVDYSFALPLSIENTGGTHRIAITASWPVAHKAAASKPTTPTTTAPLTETKPAAPAPLTVTKPVASTAPVKPAATAKPAAPASKKSAQPAVKK